MLQMFNTLIHRKGLVQQSLPPDWWPYRDPSLQGVPCTELGFQGPLSASGKGPLNVFSTTKNNN